MKKFRTTYITINMGHVIWWGLAHEPWDSLSGIGKEAIFQLYPKYIIQFLENVL